MSILLVSLVCVSFCSCVDFIDIGCKHKSHPFCTPWQTSPRAPQKTSPHDPQQTLPRALLMAAGTYRGPLGQHPRLVLSFAVSCYGLRQSGDFCDVMALSFCLFVCLLRATQYCWRPWVSTVLLGQLDHRCLRCFLPQEYWPFLMKFMLVAGA